MNIPVALVHDNCALADKHGLSYRNGSAHSSKTREKRGAVSLAHWRPQVKRYASWPDSVVRGGRTEMYPDAARGGIPIRMLRMSPADRGHIGKSVVCDGPLVFAMR